MDGFDCAANTSLLVADDANQANHHSTYGLPGVGMGVDGVNLSRQAVTPVMDRAYILE